MKKISILFLASAISFSAFAQQPLDTLKMDELRKSPVLSVEEAIAGRVPGVNISFTDDAPGRTAGISVRGCDILNPVFVVDGIRVSQSFVQSINPAQVENIVVLTDIAATSRYGMEGFGGVIEITMKKGSQGKTRIEADAMWGANLLSTASLSGTDYVGGAMSPALLHDYSVSVSGGSTAAGNRFFANIGYLGDGGVLKGTSFNRIQGSLRYEQNLSRSVTVNIGASYRSSRKNGIDTDVPYADYVVNLGVPTMNMAPNAYIMYYVMGQGTDPVSTLENAYSKTIRAFVSGDFGLDWNISKCLKFNLRGSYSAGTVDDQDFNNKRTLYGAPSSPFGMNVNSSALSTRDNRYSAEALLSFDKTFSAGNTLSATAGFLFGGSDFGFRGQRAYDMTTEALGTAAINTGLFIPVANYDGKLSHLQAYVRAMYSIKGRYEVFASLSSDKFNGSQKGDWKLLPSVGAAWNFGRESFAEGGILSSGRLTASWGMSGMVVPVTSPVDIMFADAVGRQLDASLSAGLWDERLNAKLGFYNIGFDDVKCSGVELSAKGYPVRTDNLKWSVFANETFGFGDVSANWGGAGTVLELSRIDVSANMYWNPRYFRCANVTAGYTLGRDVLKCCSLRLFVNARSLFHKSIYKDFDFSTMYASSAPGRFGLTGGFSIDF